MNKHRKQTLVIVAHPDDEAISCGGLIQNRLNAGYFVNVVVMCGRKYPGVREPELLLDLQKADKDNLFRSMRCLELEHGHMLEYMYYAKEEGEPFKHGYYDWLGTVERELSAYGGYDEVVIPSPRDLNQDHRHLSEICTIALRPANLGKVKSVLMWHGMDGGTPAGANWFEPLNWVSLETKKNALRCYESEVRPLPHPRSFQNMEAHARMCGSIAGYEFAEPYTLHLRR